MKNIEKLIYVWVSVPLLLILFMTYDLWRPVNNPWAHIETYPPLQGEFEIAEPLHIHVHPSLEEVSMWHDRTTHRRNVGMATMYFYIQNTSDYTINGLRAANLEVYYSGYWRTVPSAFVNPMGASLSRDGSISRIDIGFMLSSSSPRRITVFMPSHELLPGQYRLRFTSRSLTRNAWSAIRYEINHDVIAEFYISD